MRFSSVLLILASASALTAVVACSAGGLSSTSGAPDASGATADLDAARLSDAKGDPHAVDAADAAPPQGLFVRLDGVAIPLDESKAVALTTTDFNGTDWLSEIKAPILNPEQYAWNPEKLPAYIEIYDEQTHKIPLAIGDFSCLRGGVGSPTYGFTFIRIYTHKDGYATLVLSSDTQDTGCTVHFAQWENGFRGSAKAAFFAGQSVVAFVTATWNLPP